MIPIGMNRRPPVEASKIIKDYALPSLQRILAIPIPRSRGEHNDERAVSSMSIAVLSTSTASFARTSGETLRSRSRLSRSRLLRLLARA